jgi:hypothetical protein
LGKELDSMSGSGEFEEAAGSTVQLSRSEATPAQEKDPSASVERPFPSILNHDSMYGDDDESRTKTAIRRVELPSDSE